MTITTSIIAALLLAICLLLWFIWRELQTIAGALFQLWMIARAREAERRLPGR